MGGSLLPGLAHIGELVSVVVDPCWVLSSPDALQRCWTGEATFFLSGLPQRSKRVNGAGVVSCRRIIHRLPVDLHRLAQRLLYLCWDGQEEMGGEVPATARSGRLPIGFAGAHFLPAAGSSVRLVRPPAWPALLVLLPSLSARGGTGLQGLSSLDC